MQFIDPLIGPLLDAHIGALISLLTDSINGPRRDPISPQPKIPRCQHRRTKRLSSSRDQKIPAIVVKTSEKSAKTILKHAKFHTGNAP
jgi:hypothetical protein